MRVGFACKYIHDHHNYLSKKQIKTIEQQYNFRTTTVKKLKTLTNEQQYNLLYNIVKHNCNALHALINYLSKKQKLEKMMRIGSDICPMFTHPEFKWFYNDLAVFNYLSTKLNEIGIEAKENNIRLSMHPGQYTVLNSVNPAVRISAIAEVEYHTEIAKWLGYGEKRSDFVINLHVGSKVGGIEQLKQSISQLSPEARNLIAFENDEVSWGLNEILESKIEYPLVLDIHHHWVRTGEYISANDMRINKIIETWYGIQPKIHYSVSKPELFNRLNTDFPQKSNNSIQKLRAHSDYYWNDRCNEWASSFLEKFDIMCESKAKNQAVKQFLQKIS